jgi:hypothetical protein
MKEKSIMILAWSLLLLSFVASSFDDASVQGSYVLEMSNSNRVDSCNSDLYLLEGKYVVPCVEGALHWESKKTVSS